MTVAEIVLALAEEEMRLPCKCNYVQQVAITIPGMLNCVLHLLDTGVTIDCVCKIFDASLLSKNVRIQMHVLNKCIVLIVENL